MTRLVSLCLFLVATCVSAAEPEMRAHFIDVGQGACTLLEFPCGAILIDTGGQDDEHVDHLVEYLQEFFARRTDLNNELASLIISHPHLDHTRGVKAVFSNFRVRNYLDNGIVTGSGKAGPKFVRENHPNVIRVINNEDDHLPSTTGLSDEHIDPIACPDCDPVIRVLSGGLTENPGWTDGEFENQNNHSVVVRVDFGESSFLFTGDLETPAIEKLVEDYANTNLLDVDVYLCGHHGSANGTTDSLVSEMTPQVAVFGVGKASFGRNKPRGFNTFSFGHPRRSIVELLSAAIPGRRSRPIEVEVADKARRFSPETISKRIYATGWDGDVTLTATFDGKSRVRTSVSHPRTRIVDLPESTESVQIAAIRTIDDAVAIDDALGEDADGSSTEVPGADESSSEDSADDGVDDTVAAAASEPQPYQWNLTIPEKKPMGGGNGKLVLFDVSHGGASGQADWVIDGGFSDFADALAKAGFTVREYRGVDKNGDGVIRFFDDRDPNAPNENEATIELSAIQEADVFVMAETNRPLLKEEYETLVRFVESGKGLFLIADHYNADRNLDSWDATEIFNGYNRSTSDQFELGGNYGDLRNPGDATSGWLATNFGIRFRFNAIDCFRGASDIVAPEDTEQLTKDVRPILMAAGCTLAITDPVRAKGLVYLRPSDRAKSWSRAIEGEDEGLYFGARDEGPYAAISKPNAGKAAFIGDSSPIEDNTPKYLNELDGRKKKLHNGWNDPGNAAKLCLNIVNWLATPEAYIGFTPENSHTPGIATPEPLAAVELDDPADGQPWRELPGGYDPWNTDTFAPGSFGAKFPRHSTAGSGTTPQGGSSGNSLNVPQALGKPDGSVVTVEGVIIAEQNHEFGLRLSDSTTAPQFLSVQVPRDFRARFSPRLNSSAIGERVRITGKRGNYDRLPGIRDVSSIKSVSGM